MALSEGQTPRTPHSQAEGDTHGFRGEIAKSGHREKAVPPKENSVLGLETQPTGQVPELPSTPGKSQVLQHLWHVSMVR